MRRSASERARASIVTSPTRAQQLGLLLVLAALVALALVRAHGAP